MGDQWRDAGARPVGFVEVWGLPASVLIADAMVKAAPVRLAGLEANTLGAMVIKVTGETGAVRAAFDVGRSMAQEFDVAVGCSLAPRYSSQAQWLVECEQSISGILQSRTHLLPEEPPYDRPPQALGLVETKGFVGAVAALDVMLKAARVHLVCKDKIGAIRVCVIVRGDISSVVTAVEAGSDEASRVGTLAGAHVIARPDPVIQTLFPA